MSSEMENKLENTVEVIGAYKRYSSNDIILRGLNMTVQSGTVYAFLGPSGCGKTTLLKCIVGRLHLDAGEIIVDVKHKAEIGYMPQETALLEELTIKETLAYYGLMFSIRKLDLKKRKEELMAFLELPPETRIIGELSGGQKRRVSLCIALLHNPQLLILDEPTVGVDPILSNSIWEYLMEISRIGKKTVIITTHYIEEARHGHKVGMMRGGVLLAEGDPSNIMAQHGCGTLEDVFLKLSYSQGTTESDALEQFTKSYPRPSIKPKLPLNDEQWFSLSHLYSNVVKNVYFLKRSSIVWFLLFINPLLQCLIFEFVADEPHGLKLGIVNDEDLYSQVGCEAFYNVTCFPSSCKYIAALKEKGIELISYEDEHDAFIDVKKNRIWGYLYFSSNFTAAVQQRLRKNKGATDEIVDLSEIKVSMDMSNQYIREFLKRVIFSSFLDYLEEVNIFCNWTVQHVKLPIKFNKPVYGAEKSNFSDFPMVGTLLLLEFFLPVAYSLATLKDKTGGVLERNLVSGMTNLEILVGHGILTIIIFIFQTSSMMFIIYGIYDHRVEGSYILIISLIFLIGVVGMVFGYVMSLACDRDSTALYFALGTFVSLANLSGMFWPVEGMHYLLRSASWLLPLSPATEAFRAIAGKSWTLAHPVVYNGFLSIIFYIVLLMFIIFLIISNNKKM